MSIKKIFDENNIKKQIETLTKEILKYNFEYYNLNSSSISDAEFDIKLSQLKKLEQEYPMFAYESSPTNTVGGFVSSEFKSIKHDERLYSLRDIFSFEELYKFDNDMKEYIEKPVYSVELKIDGIAMVLTYENGFLISAATRGDGSIGEDVTMNIRTIKSIPQVIDINDRIQVRGEVFMPRKSFNTYNDNIIESKQDALKSLNGLVNRLKTLGLLLSIDENEFEQEKIDIWLGEIDLFFKENKDLWEELNLFKTLKPILKAKVLSNPRNSASGSVRNLDTSVTKKRNLDFIPYGTNLNTYEYFNELSNFSHSKTVDLFVDKLKFNRPSKDTSDSIENVVKFINKIEETRDDLPYDIDGVVIKVDDIRLHENIGFTSKFPKWAVAYKFKPQPQKTILLDVKYQVGKSGVVTPVAIVKPIGVSGSIISKVTLHNYQYITDNNIKINSTVTIHKAGDVIPQIIECTDNVDSIEIFKIENCPSCGEKLKEDGIKFYCVNEDCSSKMSQKISHFASRNNMDIESLSIKNVELLMDYGLISDAIDLYSLTVEKLITLPRFQEKSAIKLIEQLEISKNKPLENLLSALAITGVGIKNAQYLGTTFITLENIIKYFTNDLLLTKYLDDFSSKSILNLKKYFDNFSNLYEKILKYKINTTNNKNYFLEDNEKLLQIYLYFVKQYVNSSNVKQSSKRKYEYLKSYLDNENDNFVIEKTEFTEYKFTKKLLTEFNLILDKLEKSNIIDKVEKDKYINLVLEKDGDSNASMFKNKKVVVTGTLEMYKRTEVEEIIRKLEGNVQKSVSKNTDYLIYGENAGSKFNKAMELGIETFSEQEFIAKLKEN